MEKTTPRLEVIPLNLCTLREALYTRATKSVQQVLFKCVTDFELPHTLF